MEFLELLSDEELLDYLMTSDFEDEMKPADMKFIINKWRYFYRILHGRYNVIKSESEVQNSKFENEIKLKNNQLNEALKKSANIENILDSMKTRKLTLKERLKGKININYDNL